MKFWRTTAAFALIGAVSAGSALAAMVPRSPAAAQTTSSGGSGPGSISCNKETNLTPIFGLAMCKEMNEDTQQSFGNGFPWENSTFFFSTFRNQYLYPSTTIDAMREITASIGSIHARANSFASSSTSVYGNFNNGAPSTINVSESLVSSLVSTFSSNSTGGVQLCSLTGTDAAPITIGTGAGPREGRLLSDCTTCPGASLEARGQWCDLGDINGTNPNVLVDTTLSVTSGGSGNTAWDVTSSAFGQGCAGPQRAFGSGSFANPNHLTTALGIDEAAFVWVFRGLAPPPPATVEQQIKEIVRLLLTPEGLRCSGLDLHPDNGLIEDDPIVFPDGATVDPIQPQVSTGGLTTGDEAKDGLRAAGFRAP